ncbi:MAG: glycoside hydrolase family 3 C-terminal domain-containing protein, partial [Parabacteroides sp.]|nr:glycoside hydrolase family 3 C-terminal domain-containing protein [Parabacteroides sp.]
KVINSIIDQCNIDGQKGIKATFWNNAGFKGTPVANLQIKEPINVTTMGQYTFAPKVSNENFSAIYETVYKPTESGEKVFRIDVFGRAELFINGTSIYRNTHWWSNLSSRIPYNFEKGKEYKIEFKFNQSEKTDAGLKLDFGSESPIKYEELITKVKKADLVIFVGGLSSRLEGEEMPITYPGFKGGDRTDIELPAVQRNCLKALKEAGKKIILVNCSGSAIAFESETESCQAILQAWYPGEKGGTAVADVLFGDYNPAGKLPVTFYKNSSQLPNFEDYSMKGRTYRYMKEDPLFPFGYGLSYTTFKVGTAKAVQTTIKAGDDMTLTVPISNTGKRDGAEVIQVYIHKFGDSEGPIKTLRAFKRVDIKAGKSTDVNIPLDAETFQCYNPLTQTMEVAPGKYELMYGTSSDMKNLKTLKVTLQ